MSRLFKEEIKSIEQINENIFSMCIYSEVAAKYAVPGQFVNIKCETGLNAYLRRPISICDINRDEKYFEIIFQVKGKGTKFLSLKKAGEIIDFMGPLGTGFDVKGDYRNIVVIGGGIGIFPLIYLLKKSKAEVKRSILGFRNQGAVILKDRFEAISNENMICTDDGSMGMKGFVTDALEMTLQNDPADLIYACGPIPMLKNIVKITNKYNIKTQISMEQRMGCGIGACLVCVCKTRAKAGEEPQVLQTAPQELGRCWDYSRVCVDGPVFWAEDVIFE